RGLSRTNGSGGSWAPTAPPEPLEPYVALNRTVMVTSTSTGLLFNSVGVNVHCRAASIADSTNSGRGVSTPGRETGVSEFMWPSTPMRPERFTAVFGAGMIGGQIGLALVSFPGALIWPPTRTGDAAGSCGVNAGGAGGGGRVQPRGCARSGLS